MIKDIAQAHLPDPLYSIIGTTYCVLHPRRQSRIMYPKEGCLKVITPNERYYTLRHTANGGQKERQEMKYARYTDDEFCSVALDDFVVDVGAFVGEFTLPAANQGKEVLAIEPDPKSYRCLTLQTADRDNITVLNELPYEERKTVQFKSARDGSDSSVIDVDKGKFKGIEVLAKPLDEILAAQNVTHVDFVKIDAEGAEPEVLRGIQDTTVDKFAVDVGAERGGAETKNQVRKILEDRGYDCKVTYDENNDPILFATT